MDDYLKTNLSLWNEWARINRGSAFYDVEGFKAGRSSLKRVEVEEVGDVAGKSLLHLQCHFGLDTLSWARLGAEVVGVDFSPEAVALARSLAEETRTRARFVCSNVYDLPEALGEQFDIVFTSYGVLSWLSDLRRWGEVIAHFLNPGGMFYVIEFHPFMLMLDEEESVRIKYPYFPASAPLEFQEQGSYAERDANFSHPSYQWLYTLSDVLNSLIRAGLRIDFMREFPFSGWKVFPFMEGDGCGEYRLKDRPDWVPMMFSIRATKPAPGA